VWWDHNLSAGGRFVAEIKAQLDAARVVLVVISATAPRVTRCGAGPSIASPMMCWISICRTTSYELTLRQFIYKQRITSEEHLVLREAAERAVEKAPNDANAWALLAHAHLEDYKHEFNHEPDAQSTFRKNHFERWIFSQPELIARVEEGFAKARLKFDCA
jgi:hypothetical protein